MNDPAQAILSNLSVVDGERRRRSADPDLAARVDALKAFQQQRFAQTYRDLLLTPRYGPASRFFLDELYGPADFARRDAQFVRVVPALVRLFPAAVVETVAALAELHALSESLDTAMGSQLANARVTPQDYAGAWQATGRDGDRDRQVELMVEVASRLERLTGKPLLRESLRLMRGPARAAGLSELQHVLETGFETFRAMKGAAEFMSTIQSRERALASLLFSADLDSIDGRAVVERALLSSGAR